MYYVAAPTLCDAANSRLDAPPLLAREVEASSCYSGAPRFRTIHQNVFFIILLAPVKDAECEAADGRSIQARPRK
eukprot:scaffold94576_cov14-Prasinocladus_malaysianus.AAC.1